MSFLCLLAAAFAGCGPDSGNKGGKGDFNLEINGVGHDYVELNVTAPGEVEMAYSVLTESQLVTAPVLFMTGKTMTVKPGETIRIGGNLQSGTDYFLYAAAKIDSKNYSKLVQLEFTTESYQFNKLLTLLDTYYDGYKIHFTLPEDTKQNGNVIRYNMVDQAMYNVLIKNAGSETDHILESVVMNGYRHGKFVKNDSTCLFNHGNQVMVDENGNPIVDKDGDMIDIHLPAAPGEPTVFLAGECRLGTDEEMGAIVGLYYGTKGQTYQVPLFDWKTVDPNFDWKNTERDSWEGSGWTGAFQKLVFKTKEPGLCDATVNIDIPENEIKVTDATIYFEPEEGVSRYIYAILDNETYNSAIEIYFDLKSSSPQSEIDKAFQWFLTSYTAFQELGVQGKTEAIQVNAAEHFINGALIGGETYHVICTVMVDDPSITENPENGASQRYIHKTFKAKDKTKKPPVIEVKAVNTTNPFEATFNIKAPGKDIEGVYWACNTAREFDMALRNNTYSDLLMGNYTLPAEELQQINSDAGLDMTFNTLDGEITRFAIMGCNDEYTFNQIDPETEGKGWADYKAPMANKVAKIESPLYTALDGDWTATATLRVNQQLEDGSLTSRNVTHTSKISISNQIPDLPEKVEEYVYGLYEGKDKAEVDGMYEELLGLADEFAEYRLDGQNRMLCAGFLDFDYYDDMSRLAYMSPYDLFTSTNYSSFDVPQLIYDFGPKWFLQLQEDGSVIVPMNSTFLPPMHTWTSFPYYVGAYGLDKEGTAYAFYDANETIKGFPVEISDDYSKITIKPIEIDGCPYYMNALGVNPQAMGSVEIVATVISEIVLTKGWNETKAVNAGSFAAVPAKAKAVTADGRAVVEMPATKIYKSMTELKPKSVRNFKVDENPNVITMDKINASVERILTKYGVE